MAVDEARYTADQIRAFQELVIGARRALGLTQIQVGERAGVSQTFISAIERSPKPGMRIDELFRLLSVLGLEPNMVAEALGYFPSTHVRVPEDPRLGLVINRIQSLPEEAYTLLLTTLEWTLRGATGQQ